MARRSFSQFDLYGRCPERYRLQRIVKVPEPPSMWLPAGSVAGEACDMFDYGSSRDNVIGFFEERFEEAVAALEEQHEMPRSLFQVNGKNKTSLPEGKTFEWWVANFPVMLDKYITWRETSGYEVAVFDGELAIELEIHLDLGQGTEVVGYADRLFVRPDGKFEVVDLKAGMSQPGVYQLATYSYGIAVQYGVDVPYGSFFMLQKNGQSKPQWLPKYTAGSVVQQSYRRLDEAIKAGHFVPNISGDCARCPMSEHCAFVGFQTPIK